MDSLDTGRDRKDEWIWNFEDVVAEIANEASKRVVLSVMSGLSLPNMNYSKF